MNHTILTLAVFAAYAAPAMARQEANPAPQVVVNGALTDIEAGREFVAGKKIIGRKRIEESGLPTVQALLKRDPSVSIGADGRIGLQGLPGYTQILVDGAPPPGGKSLDLELVHVEKIEIIKSSVAEYGPYGIAGTINIVRRKAALKTDTAMTVGVHTPGGKPSGSMTLSHNRSTIGSPLRVSANVSVGERNSREAGTIRQTVNLDGPAEQDVYEGVTRGSDRSRSADANGDLQWQLSPAHSLSFSPGAGRMWGRGEGDEVRRWDNGDTLDVHAVLDTRMTMITAPLKWMWKVDASSNFEASIRHVSMRFATETLRVDTAGMERGTTRLLRDDKDFSGNTISVTYKTRVAKAHSIKLGATYRADDERADYDYLIDNARDTTLDYLGSQRRSLKRQRRVSLQDDWRINASTAINAGVSGEVTNIDLSEAGISSRPHYSLWSPSLHLSRKIGGSDERQLRVSIARTYRAPDTGELSPRPQINPLAPCTGRTACQANTIDTADTAGNPGLQPERSLGLNLSYEHGIGEDSQLTAEFFARRVDRKTGTSIALEAVPWSDVARYVARPVNLGEAQVRGVNLEMELAVRDVLDTLSADVSLRGSVSWAKSSISTLPGPDNRLDGQTPWRAKLGATHQIARLPLKLDVDASWSQGVWIRPSLAQRFYLAPRLDISASAAWRMASGQRLTIELQHLGRRASHRIDEYTAPGERIRLYTDTEKFPKLAFRFETKL